MIGVSKLQAPNFGKVLVPVLLNKLVGGSVIVTRPASPRIRRLVSEFRSQSSRSGSSSAGQASIGTDQSGQQVLHVADAVEVTVDADMPQPECVDRAEETVLLVVVVASVMIVTYTVTSVTLAYVQYKFRKNLTEAGLTLPYLYMKC